ncbi:MAG: VCBS repeat-containing protein, partial [Moritella dasanensis]
MMSNNIIGYVKEITGKVTATDPISGSVRILKLGDAVYEGEVVTGQQDDSFVLIGFIDSEVTITLAGNQGLLFDASLRDAKFQTTEQEIEEEEEDMAPSAGEEDTEDESQAESEFSNRTADETDINTGLRDTSFLQSHGSFAIANSEESLSLDPILDITIDPTLPPTRPSPPPISKPELPDKKPIINDVPEAAADNVDILEDQPVNTILGNVFTNDDIGNDVSPLPVTQINGITINQTNTIESNYGVLKIDALGKFSYQLDNNNLTVQGLTTGEKLTETFSYMITDNNGNSATSTLTITIKGTNDGVTLTIPNNTLGDSDEQVFESGLADGSNPSDADIVNSSFNLIALDGLQSVMIAGVSITAAALVESANANITVTTTYGSLVINGYSQAADGTLTVNYQYTLADNANHNGGSLSDDISIVVTDTDNETTTDTLNIAIIDDVASVVVDTNSINEDTTSITDNVFSNDTLGADQTISPVTGIALGSTGSDASGNVATALA